MKQAALLGERQAGLIDVPDLEPKEDWAVVQNPRCSDVHGIPYLCLRTQV